MTNNWILKYIVYPTHKGSEFVLAVNTTDALKYCLMLFEVVKSTIIRK